MVRYPALMSSVDAFQNICVELIIKFIGMSIGLLTIWQPMPLRVTVVMYGHARTMMGMCRVISQLKVYMHFHFLSATQFFEFFLKGHLLLSNRPFSHFRFWISWIDDISTGTSTVTFVCMCMWDRALGIWVVGVGQHSLSPEVFMLLYSAHIT